MRFAKDHRGIPICMKVHPKTSIPLLPFAIPRGIVIPQSIMIMLALSIVYWMSPIVLRMSFSNWGLIRRLILSRYSKDSPTSAI
jgi:hypothetical protein